MLLVDKRGVVTVFENHSKKSDFKCKASNVHLNLYVKNKTFYMKNDKSPKNWNETYL